MRRLTVPLTRGFPVGQCWTKNGSECVAPAYPCTQTRSSRHTPSVFFNILCEKWHIRGIIVIYEIFFIGCRVYGRLRFALLTSFVSKFKQRKAGAIFELLHLVLRYRAKLSVPLVSFCCPDPYLFFKCQSSESGWNIKLYIFMRSYILILELVNNVGHTCIIFLLVIEIVFTNVLVLQGGSPEYNECIFS